MAEATNQQMQTFADERVRPRAEQLVRLYNAMKDDKASIGDVYDRADGGAAWNDARTDGPPTLLTSDSMLKYNAFIDALIAEIEGHAEWGNIRAMAVNGLQV